MNISFSHAEKTRAVREKLNQQKKDLEILEDCLNFLDEMKGCATLNHIFIQYQSYTHDLFKSNIPKDLMVDIHRYI